jgi:hypothetical protein
MSELLSRRLFKQIIGDGTVSHGSIKIKESSGCHAWGFEKPKESVSADNYD